MASRAARLGQAVLDLIIDDSKFHSKLSGAYRAAQSFTDQTAKNLSKAGKAITGVGESWTRNITAPIALAGGAVTKFGFDFDKTMREVVALTSVTDEQIGGIREELLRLGPEVGKSPQELAEAFYFVASAGFEGAEAMEVIRATAKAAAAGLGDTSTVAKVVGSAINAYGRDNITAAEATDTLVAAIGEGSAEAPEFAGALGNVIGSAAQIGAKFSDVTAAIAAMTNVGIGADEAVTSLNQVFVSLFKPTAEANDALEKMGLSAAGLRRMIADEGLLPTLQLLDEKFAGNAEATAQVFGNVRALRGVLALTGGDVEKTTALFDRMQDTVGATGEAFDQVASSDSFKLEQAIAQLQATAIELGADTLPIVAEVLGEVADKASDLADWWRTLDDGTKDLIVQALAFIAIVGPVLVVLGKLTTGLGSVAKAVAFLAGPAVTAKLALFGANIKKILGPIGLLWAAVELLDVGTQALNETIGGSAAAMEHLADSTGKSNTEIKTTITDLANSTGRSFDDIAMDLDRMVEGGLSWEEAVKDAAEGVTAATANTVANMARDAESWDTAMLSMAESTTERTNQARGEIEGLSPEVVDILQEAGVPIGDAADGTMEEIAKAAEEAKKAAVARITEMLNDIDALFDNPEDFEKRVQDYFDVIADPFKDTDQITDAIEFLLSSEIPESLRSGSTPAKKATADIVQEMLQIIETLKPGALATGRGLPPEVQAGMEENLDPLIQWVRDQFIVPLIDQGLTEEEAWREAGFEDIGFFRDGIRANERAASNAAATAGNLALESLIQEESWRNAGRNIVDLIANGVDERTWKLQSAMYGAAQAARSVMPFSEPKDPRSPLRGLRKAGEAIIDMVAAGAWGHMSEAERVAAAMAGAFRPTIPAINIPAPNLPGVAGLSAMSRTTGSGAFAGTGGGTLTEIHNLNVNGMPIVVGSREDVLDGWDRLRTAADHRKPTVN